MPESQTVYLENHQRIICPGCLFWVTWYNGKNRNEVKGCLWGVIPEKMAGQWHCPKRKGKKEDQATVEVENVNRR